MSPRVLHGRMFPEVRGVTVEPAHVALIDRLDVVADRTVVTARVPSSGDRRRQLQILGDLRTHQSLVELTQRLVVQIGI
ncbi:Uncharacterised protein [Mycobacteroides abscessus subsp. abscessus]|nr:Uncharacterised protein [Mycobacteroides abscessus subsp. abscessus]